MEMISISGFFLIFGKSNRAPPSRLPLSFFGPSRRTEWPSQHTHTHTMLALHITLASQNIPTELIYCFEFSWFSVFTVRKSGVSALTLTSIQTHATGAERHLGIVHVFRLLLLNRAVLNSKETLKWSHSESHVRTSQDLKLTSTFRRSSEGLDLDTVCESVCGLKGLDRTERKTEEQRMAERKSRATEKHLIFHCSETHWGEKIQSRFRVKYELFRILRSYSTRMRISDKNK